MNLNIINDLRGIYKDYKLVEIVDGGISIINTNNNKQIDLYRHDFNDIDILTKLLEPYSK
jgi:hypothetical protein